MLRLTRSVLQLHKPSRIAYSTMKAAVIHKWGETPSVANLPNPTAEPGKVLITVQGAGLHPIVRLRAAGKHPTAQSLPHTLGADGVGTTEDGKRVYFSTLAGPSGAFAEQVSVPESTVYPLPASATSEPLKIAAMVNPALASWLALKYRVKDVRPAFNLLVIGATSTAGRLANGIARHFGASKVFGVARSPLSATDLGLDGYVSMNEPYDKVDVSAFTDIDVVLDFVGGSMAWTTMQKVNVTRPLQYVTIGSLGGSEEALPMSIVRFKDITVRGSSPGAWSIAQMSAEIPNIMAAGAKIGGLTYTKMPLSEIGEAWGKKSSERVVVTLD